MTCYIPEHNIQLVDIGMFFDKIIETDIINRLKEHNLLIPKIKLKNQDTIKIIHHYVTFHICEYIRNLPKGKVILCLTDNNTLNCEMFNYCDKLTLIKSLKTLFKKIQRVIPITFIELPGVASIQDFCEGIKSHKGECIEQLEKILADISKRDKIEYSLKEAKAFTALYKLYFLNREYFNELKVRSSLAIR